MTTEVLAPHKEQERWIYVRLYRKSRRNDILSVLGVYDNSVWGISPVIGAKYIDSLDGSRVISSRRVEESVEIVDYLKLCFDDGLSVIASQKDSWFIDGGYPHETWGSTLKEAYEEYQNKYGRT